MRQCKYCDKYYPEMDFGVAKTTPVKIYRRRKCRYCYRKTKNLLKSTRRQWINDYKAKHGCEVCGNKDPRVLDFHHKEVSEKKFNIADFYYVQFSMEKTKEEIFKCMVVCANCHRILHHEARNCNKK